MTAELRFACRPRGANAAAALRNRHRILVLGSGGAGKSTLARALGAALGLPVIHLDRHYWRAGWQALPASEWSACVAALAARDRWIMDGNYSGTLALRLSRCDAIVFLDRPRVLCLWRVLKRRIATRRTARPDMADGCHDRLTLGFVRWIWRYPQRSRPRVLAAIAAVAPRAEILILRGRGDTERLLDCLRRKRVAS